MKTIARGTRSSLLRVATMLALSSAAVGRLAHAAETQLTLDPAQTKIDWSLGATMHTARGTFKLESGEIQFDLATGVVGGRIVIDAKSGSSGNDGRDKKMHREVLESERYPEIVFNPKSFKGTVPPSGAGSITLDGTFTLHGADHPFSMTLELSVSGKVLSATTNFKVPFVAWGLKDPSVFVLRVDKEVLVSVSTSGTLR